VVRSLLPLFCGRAPPLTPSLPARKRFSCILPFGHLRKGVSKQFPLFSLLGSGCFFLTKLTYSAEPPPSLPLLFLCRLDSWCNLIHVAFCFSWERWGPHRFFQLLAFALHSNWFPLFFFRSSPLHDIIHSHGRTRLWHTVFYSLLFFLQMVPFPVLWFMKSPLCCKIVF